MESRNGQGQASQARFLASILALFVLSCAAPVSHAQAKARFDLPSQPLADSLRAVGSQANVNVLFDPPLVADHQAPVLKGTFTTDQAFTLLLRDTGIKHDYMNDRTIVLAAAPATGKSAGAGNLSSGTIHLREAEEGYAREGGTEQWEVREQGEAFWKRFRLAQAETNPSSPGRRAGDERGSQDADLKKLTLEEVIVTAQKREERLQDVPISISVLDGSELDKSSVQGVTEALRRAPGVGVVEAAQGGGTQLTVRGATNAPMFAGGTPVAYYLDSLPFGFVRHAIAPDANAYDLERVEVLRGPQGTLYGAGGAAGVVRVLTQDANLQDLEFKGRGSTSSTEGAGSEDYRADMAVNVPIIQDKLAVRAVAGYNRLAGWIDGPNTRDINDAKLANYRFKLGAQPTEDLTISLSSWFSRNDYDALSLADDDGRFNSDLGQPTSTDFSAYGATIGYQFSGVSLTSATSYIDYSNETDQDLAWLLGPSNRLVTTPDSRVFSEEILLTSTNHGPWEWSAGAFYRDVKDESVSNFITPPTAAIVSSFEDTSESYAVFGELHRRLLDEKLKLTLGLRYFQDDVSTQGRLVDLNRHTSTSEKTTPRAVLTWFPSADLSAYASYSEGFRSGFPQYELVTTTIPNFPAAKPDTLHNYEIGAKGNLFDRRITFDVALYYMRWQDIQTNVIVTFPNGTFGPGIVNASSASGPGFDFSFSTQPVEGLELGAAFSWNDLTFDSDVVSEGILFAEGSRLNNSPERMASGFAEYAFPLGTGGFTARISCSVNYTSGQLSSTFTAREASKSLLVSRAGISVEAPTHWTATIYGDNLNNEQDAVQAGLTPAWSSRLRPRTVGFQLEYHY